MRVVFGGKVVRKMMICDVFVCEMCCVFCDYILNCINFISCEV